MSLKIFNDIIALLANALRFYALKYFVGIFVQKEESRWKHVSILYIIGWAWTSAISLLFSSPAMNILSNITSLFLIFFPYRIKKTKKCLAVFIIYVINALVLVLCNVAVTIAFYILLKKLNTPNLIFSTISVVTSFFAASLTMLRSSYYALGYASNDIVLIILWILASIKDPGYIPVVVNFLIFFLNDMYGFICWKKRETAQC